jgi:hypothetical protein
VTVGGALVGATAIAFSVVVFSVQINVERTPFGLFQSISRDWRLIVTFVATVTMSIICAALSIFADPGRLALVTVLALWSALCVPLLIVYAYTRALALINPLHQLSVLYTKTTRHLSAWSKRADRLRPWIVKDMLVPHDASIKFDWPRFHFLSGHSRWVDLPCISISQAFSYSRTYARTGDSEVVDAALRTIVGINSAYIKSKGRTFHSHNPLVNSDLSSDRLIQHTLELFRQNISGAVQRKDETEITQLLGTLCMLVGAYSKIQYPRPEDPSHHAMLAAEYLVQEVTNMLPNVSTDAMMRGAQFAGAVSRAFFHSTNSQALHSVVSSLLTIARYGVAVPHHGPATVAAIEQITNMSALLLRVTTQDAADALSLVTKQIFEFAKLVFKTPDQGLTTPHAQHLAPYFGGGQMLDTQTFDVKLTEVVNFVRQADKDDAGAQAVISNLADWSDELPSWVRDLLSAATVAGTRFTAPIVFWLIHVATALYGASTATAGDEDDKEKLKERAAWVMSAINFIPHDKRTVELIDHVDLPTQLFQMAGTLRAIGLNEEVVWISKIIRGWLLGAIQHISAHKLADGLFGLVAIYSLLGGAFRVNALSSKLREKLPLTTGSDPQYAPTLLKRIQRHLLNLETGKIDQFSTVERMAASSQLPLLKSNLQVLIAAITTPTSSSPPNSGQ